MQYDLRFGSLFSFSSRLCCLVSVSFWLDSRLRANSRGGEVSELTDFDLISVGADALNIGELERDSVGGFDIPSSYNLRLDTPQIPRMESGSISITLLGVDHNDSNTLMLALSSESTVAPLFIARK
eukprot:284022_1